MSAGISGSNFWIPIYMIWLGIEPRVGFWLSLLTMLFGFGSGMIRNLRQGTINWPLFRAYLVYCLPAAVVGAFLSPFAPQNQLLLLFALFILVYGIWMLSTTQKAGPHPQTTRPAGSLALFAGFLHGLIATGLGKLIVNKLMYHQQIKHHSEATGTAVALVFTVSLVAVLTRLNGAFIETLVQQRSYILSILVWTASGVMIGGQLGPMVSRKIPKRLVKPYVGLLLILVSLLMFYRSYYG